MLRGDLISEVSKLKQELPGEILVPASFQLVRTLMEYDLADELRLKVYPVLLGAGARLFAGTSDKNPSGSRARRQSMTASCILPIKSCELRVKTSS